MLRNPGRKKPTTKPTAFGCKNECLGLGSGIAPDVVRDPPQSLLGPPAVKEEHQAHGRRVHEIVTAAVVVEASVAATMKVLHEALDFAFLDVDVTNGKTFEVA
jgi:hypothetical protein